MGRGEWGAELNKEISGCRRLAQRPLEIAVSRVLPILGKAAWLMTRD